ncbi:glutamate synthase large subunit [Crassaminicella profunda]|uniref:glutamate synthase large subunit n=1 Tax=Crassaminicella profunda TaxID=1286698 RepID=UPI001CA6F7CB|nr:glutamate synthase large subunit [Crassaminicella profunda]QZY53834.1 glutamate synthase large subunit [Crassaminicella profunda]
MNRNGLPEKQGLYDPNLEKDNCGVGFIANIKGLKSHQILNQALEILKNLKHRGAVGADESTGDGSGIMLQIPHEFLKKETEKLGVKLTDAGEYAVGMIFLPRHPNARLFCEGIFERILKEENQKLLGWREVPVNEKACGESARATRPVVMQVFIDRNNQKKESFERKLLMIRKRVQNMILECKRAYTESFYICSLSSNTMIYKGQILGYKLDEFYLDLQDETMKTAIAIVHERYSTNTFPSWKLAQPFRYLAHNGEINTIRGNINWMNAREGVMHSKLFGEEFNKILPVIEAGGSDSASLDNAVELFTANGHPMENVMMMLIPEAWQNDSKMDENQRGFYEYFARLMEPWDGPATIAFSDGIKVGVTLDRNGLRPARYLITKDEMVIMASEIGVVEVRQENIAKKGRIEPGKMLLIDTEEGRIISDDEIKWAASQKKPFAEWIKKNKIILDDIKESYEIKKMRKETILLKEKVFGFTEEEMQRVIGYMAENGKEPIGSMGMDIPLAILSERPQLLFNYFKQTFAQVTNPPIDPIREEIIMSLTQSIGGHGRLLDEIEIEKEHKYIEMKQPILCNRQMEDIRHLNNDDFRAITIPITFEIDRENGLKKALDYLCKRAEESVREGCNILILSDRSIGRYNAPIPSLLSLGAVHHHLIRKKLRTSVDLIVEAGDARDVMHIALLIGYGAKAVNPYMVYDVIGKMIENKKYVKNIHGIDEGFENYCKAISAGLLKIISRMGISTLQSYNGAQIFQAVGVNQNVIDAYFTDTPAQLSGMDLEGIAKEVIIRHVAAYEKAGRLDTTLDIGGELSYKKDGEYHILNPEVVKRLRKSCLENDYYLYKGYAKEVNEQNEKIATIRGLLQFKNREGISIEEVEPIENILKRFTIGGMSFGSLSKEAHETIAIAMNRIGASSNSGEGGEDPSRYIVKPNGDHLRSAVKQVASGRFGVTTNYLVNCDELQIKMAQGAKPGEGGHLPGNKVTSEIAKVRHAMAGIDLISPPPHHDIYSIEDLAQLIFDLKNANPSARVNVKLVAEAGVGTVAAGVAKGYADVVMISGHDGGTGASPMSSMKYVGLPWELGLAETQQTLLLNNLRSRITIQVDGKMRSGRDVVIAALLGAEEYGFATTALVSLGCIMCRQCHLNRCPAGIATQDDALRERFSGKVEHLIRYLRFIAQETREIMAELGFKTIDEMIGRVDVLKAKEMKKDKLKDVDLSAVLYRPQIPSRIIDRCTTLQDHKIHDILDRELIKISKGALEKEEKVQAKFKIKNTDRTVGTMLSGEIAKKYGDEGLLEDTITLNFEGSAGQSFGAFAATGLTLILEGDANDYLGKGLSGGKIILVPPKKATFIPEDNMIAGNTLLYGATSGEAYIQGLVGQRFCVRNSGAVAVVEGIGNHGCEYMTGGTVVILGSVGRNFGAGMSGGVAYVLNENGDFHGQCNKQIVEIKSLEDQDKEVVKKLVKNHYAYTKSAKGKVILDHWNEYINKFVKVISPIYEMKLKEC